MKVSLKDLSFLIYAILIVLLLISLPSQTGETGKEEAGQSEIIEEENTTKAYSVTRVVDGDTVDVEVIGRIRLIGIDTPELGGASGAECLGKEAKEELERLIGEKKVTLEYDESQGLKDRYDRTLAYLFIEGVDAGKTLIEEGYAKEYTYNKDYKYKGKYLTAQELAKESERGIWGDLCR